MPNAQPASGARPRLKIAGGDGDRDEEGPDTGAEPPLDLDDLPRFGNYHHQEYIDGEGRRKLRPIAHTADRIRNDLEVIVGNWPKRVAEKLFALNRSRKPVYLSKPAKLFAWIDGLAHVDWTKGARLITQERFFEHLGMVSNQVEAIEVMPHTPPIPGIYYAHPSLPSPTGKLDELVDRFAPATPQDRELVKSLIITPSWGGLPGRRPAFLITAEPDDPEQGRGVGKSTLLGVIAECLYLGAIDLTPNDKIEDIKTRMLSPGSREKRILKLDNIKTHRFSWGELEGLITSEMISGHEMYWGEAGRPNTFTTALTLNGASLSKDMAQRVVSIVLHRTAKAPGWEAETRNFAATHRWEILADAAAFLAQPAGPLMTKSRWSDWETAILSKLADPTACQSLMLERQGLLDEGDADRDTVRNYLIELVSAKYGHADEVLTMIPSLDLAVMVSEATRKKYDTSNVTSFVEGLAIPELTKKRTAEVRGFLWRGSKRTTSEWSGTDIFRYKRDSLGEETTGWF